MRSMTTKMATRIQAAMSGMAVATPIGQGFSVGPGSGLCTEALRDSSDPHDRQLAVAAVEAQY